MTKHSQVHTFAHCPDVRPEFGVLPRIVSLYDMLRNYLPFYEIARELQMCLRNAEVLRGGGYISGPAKAHDHEIERYRNLLRAMQEACTEHGMEHTAEMVALAAERKVETYDEMYHALIHLNDSLTTDLRKEAIFRIHPDRKRFYEQKDLFGPEVAAAFPSTERDIRKAGSCYALEQEDACVHHLMLVLERGLNALAKKRGVRYDRTNWGKIIGDIATELEKMPRGPDKDFYKEVNAQFGFFKDAYRNHSEHAHEVQFDLPRARSIYNHVESFMRELVKGGLAE